MTLEFSKIAWNFTNSKVIFLKIAWNFTKIPKSFLYFVKKHADIFSWNFTKIPKSFFFKICLYLKLNIFIYNIY